MIQRVMTAALVRLVSVATVAVVLAGCGGSSPVTQTVTTTTAQISPGLHFSGNGEVILGTVTIHQASLLHWKVQSNAGVGVGSSTKEIRQ
jgi:hypothetical protein